MCYFGTYGMYTYGMYTYGMYTYGMYTYGMYTYGMYSYGMYTYGMYTYGMYTLWYVYLMVCIPMVVSAAKCQKISKSIYGYLIFPQSEQKNENKKYFWFYLEELRTS